ncbi:MAG: Fe-S cluster assembly protein HesB [Candidatus Thorarchaeota archaeon]
MSPTIEQAKIEAFQNKIMDWWGENARNLPWRSDPSPYNVLVSEVMLQQTQVSRVVPKYLRFLEEFPTLDALASSKTKPLLKVWSGLGYNRRAIWLRDAATQIQEFGIFPQTIEELRNLKGIGPYTSRSILIFAFNEDLAAVDTNIRRVLISEGFADENMTDCQLQEIAESVLLKGRSSDWHNALMDYGACVLTSSATGITSRSNQPKFAGSSRQVRGELIRTLTEVESMGMDEILTKIKCVDSQISNVEKVIDQLISDKLIERTKSGELRITQS